MSPKQTSFLRKFEKIVLIGLLLAGLIGGLIFGVLISDIARGKELAFVANYRPSTPTRLYDRNGKIFAELYRHKQELVRFNDIPPHVIQAFLAVEDDNFFNHFGIDIMGIFRAAVKNVLAGRIVQGGSTLTQQMAKQIYLDKLQKEKEEGKKAKRRKRNFAQKIKETILALQIEEEFSKEEILELYFNTIYLGHGCQGLVCASRVYFNKKPQDLTLPEGALLARLPKAPVQYSPFKDPHASMRQHKVTLRRMVASGYLEADKIEGIHKKFWKKYWGKVIVQSPSQSTWGSKLDLAPYFTDYVRQILEKVLGKEKLYTAGLKIYTTLDLNHQRIAEDAMRRSLAKANKQSRRYARSSGVGGVDRSLFGIFSTLRYVLPVGGYIIKGLDAKGRLHRELKGDMLDAAQMLTFLVPAENPGSAFDEFRKDTRSYTTNLDVQGAFINIEPRSGYITAMIGGSKFSPKNQYNRVLQARRQPGSAFKIFVYGAALESRVIGTRTALQDTPFFSIAPDGSSWQPVNYDEGFRGLVSAERAFASSLNICAVQVFMDTGPHATIDLASRLMKIKNPNRFTSDPAMALGTSEVTPFELGTGISIIANQGKDVLPFAVRYVVDQSGDIVYNNEASIRSALAHKARQGKLQVIEPGLSFALRKMMHAVTTGGTASSFIRRKGNFYGDLATKTGTTSGWSDAWIVGFNPDYATVIWFGFDKKITMGSGGSGSPMGGPFLGEFYRRIYKEQNLQAPKFNAQPDGGRPPAGVRRGPCGGWALEARVIHGKKRRVAGGVCAGAQERIRDWRDLVLRDEDLNITAEDLGEKKGDRIKFKRDQ